MNSDLRSIQALEEELIKAMQSGDTNMLDSLISDDLTFINHEGQLLDKQSDLGAHHSGILKILEIGIENQQIRMIDKVAIVTVKAFLKGQYDHQAFQGNFYYTRVWQRFESRWHVVSAHCSQVK